VHAGFDFRGLAIKEMRKYSPSYLVAQASLLIEGVNQEDYRHWGRPGIRAQLLDLDSRRLVMDFCLEGDQRSLHVLNAVSPAWTCSLPFAEHVVDEALRLGAPGA
jgi:L-2-hydroxyglutarate oxidase LhgO